MPYDNRDESYAKKRIRKSSIEWTIESTITLIKYVKQYKCLWDPNSEYYSSRDMKSNTWSEIGESLGIPKNEAVLRWNAIRGNYQFDLKRYQHTQASDLQSGNTTPFPGAQAPFVTKLKLTMPKDIDPIPIYRIMDRDGSILNTSQDPQLSKETVQKMYRDMVFLNILDKIMYESQRQGRISFYLTSYGEEGSHIGSAAALEMRDVVYGQYREAGVLVWRGFKLHQFVDQCFGNDDDLCRGRHMPIHYGSKELNFVSLSSPLATQMSQAVGAAYAMKRRLDNDACVITYFGDGAASEGDSHAALNFAATLGCPIIFFCRNNGFAISTPVREQYRGDGIAGRGPAGYGMPAIRVDGTDIFAVYNATKMAREYVLRELKPILIEALDYRVGHHSTSDDSTAYRSVEEIEYWNKNENPVEKVKRYMMNKNWWTDEEDNAYHKDIRQKVLKQVAISEKKLKPHWKEMFTDVYAEVPQHLKDQMKELEKSIADHKDYYPLKNFKH